MDSLWWTSLQHWWEQVNSTLIEFHLSETSGSCRAWTRMASFTDRYANHCAICPPPTLMWNKKNISEIYNNVEFFLTCISVNTNGSINTEITFIQLIIHLPPSFGTGSKGISIIVTGCPFPTLLGICDITKHKKKYHTNQIAIYTMPTYHIIYRKFGMVTFN